jgi:hypothetical protein
MIATKESDDAKTNVGERKGKREREKNLRKQRGRRPCRWGKWMEAPGIGINVISDVKWSKIE